MKPNQIAAEAAKQLRHDRSEMALTVNTNIIQAAIEKATEAHASESNPKCPTCARPLDDSQLGKILDAVMTQPAHASDQGAVDWKLQYESCQDALKEVMGELTECRKEHSILFRRLTKSQRPTPATGGKK